MAARVCKYHRTVKKKKIKGKFVRKHLNQIPSPAEEKSNALVVDTTSSSSLFLQLLAISSFAASKNKSSLVECHATLHPAVLLCHLVCQLVGPLLDSGPEGADDLSSHKSQYKSHIW